MLNRDRQAGAARNDHRALALMVTRRCNMTCAHCSVESSPHVNSEAPGEQELVRWIRQAGKSGLSSIQLTGGEPMLREQLIYRLIREGRKAGLGVTMTSNGYWGRSITAARRRMKALVDAGLGLLTISYDRYHREFQGHGPAVNIANAARELDFFVNINITRTADETDLEEIATPFEQLSHVRLRFYDVQPVGAARNLDRSEMRGEVDGFCAACNFPALTDAGDLKACNGPSYFFGPSHPLSIGSARERPLAELLKQHQNDPVLETIRNFGPRRLQEELKSIRGFENYPFKSRYAGMCELCHQITSDPAAVEALRRRLDDEALEAERVANAKVLAATRAKGRLTRDYANGPGACGVFLAAARNDPGRVLGNDRVAGILGRADIDWAHLARYLAACGLARPLARALETQQFARWAPRFFIERLSEHALNDGMRQIAAHQALRDLAGHVRSMNIDAVLLKGAALAGVAAERNEAASMRAAGDIDLWVGDGQAEALRRRLLESGWDGDPGAARTAPHHLAPVSRRGVPLEIHTRIMPRFWGLPESEMLGEARSIDAEDFAPLRRLSANGMIVHAATHAASHVFSHGLKTAWDLVTLQDWLEDEIGWHRVVELVQRSRLPRAFWAPAAVLERGLSLGLPEDVLSNAPADRRQHKLEIIAKARLFEAVESIFEINPLTRNGVFWLMHSGLSDKLGYVVYLLGSEATESRRAAALNVPVQHWSSLPQHFRGAFAHWRRYRRAVSRA